METTTTHPDRWLRALPLLLALFASAVSARVLSSGCTFMSQQANRKKFNTLCESGQCAILLMNILTYVRKVHLLFIFASSSLLLAEADPGAVEAHVADLVPARSATCPNITSELTVEFEYGKPFKYQIIADNEPLGYSVGGLPVWMKRNAGELYGNAVEAGTFKLQVRALNMQGLGPSKELSITVSPPKPKVTPIAAAHDQPILD